MSIKKDSYNDYMSKRGSYAIIPNEIWELTDLDHTAKFVWCYILSRKSDWQSSRNNLARNLGIHRNSITKYIRELESKNLLRKTVGPRGSWSFEIVSPNEWLIQQTGSNSTPVTDETTSGPNIGPDPGCPVPHTQEAIINTSLAGQPPSSQEARDVAPEEAEGDQREVTSSQSPENSNVTPKSILISWRKQYPQGPGFLSGKKATSALSELFFNLQKYGFHGEDIPNNQIITLAFGPNPKSKLKTWIEDIEAQIDLQRSSVFEKTIEIVVAPEVDDLSQLINPEAVAKYKQYKADGRTPADFNGMSLIDYANMRAYAESFRAITK